ncbi:MAG: tryptophan--tRNA ligase [Armatimonadota bacterium]
MKRVFSGIQPSGEIHIGNYLGAIKNWVSLLSKYDCIFCIVDYHAMTAPYDPKDFQKRIFDAAVVNIACGLDPDKCTLFVQSHVKAHTELAWILNCVTPIGELERMTQFKEKAKEFRQNINVGLLDYPVLQAADILLYMAELVPVGEDQVQHIELTREITRRFATRYGGFFPEPKEILTPTARIMGVDGKKKMSKSLGNTIGILEDKEVIWNKLKTALTDERRIRKTDPGDPDDCNIYTIHKGFSTGEQLEYTAKECRRAGIGCIDCKKILFENIEKETDLMRETAENLRKDPDKVYDILDKGAKRCGEIADETMEKVRNLTGLS